MAENSDKDGSEAEETQKLVRVQTGSSVWEQNKLVRVEKLDRAKNKESKVKSEEGKDAKVEEEASARGDKNSHVYERPGV